VQQNKATSSTDTSSDIPRKARWADGRAGEDDCRIADPQTKCARLHVQTRDLQAELLFVISSGGGAPRQKSLLAKTARNFCRQGFCHESNTLDNFCRRLFAFLVCT
jgi:hypothetical protein